MKPSRALALAVLVASATLGCERKAPGPEECQTFAFTLARMNVGPYLTPQVREGIEDVTRQCLTQPYDQAVIACVLTTGRQQACLQAFKQRRALGQ